MRWRESSIQVKMLAFFFLFSESEAIRVSIETNRIEVRLSLLCCKHCYVILVSEVLKHENRLSSLKEQFDSFDSKILSLLEKLYSDPNGDSSLPFTRSINSLCEFTECDLCSDSRGTKSYCCLQWLHVILHFWIQPIHLLIFVRF